MSEIESGADDAAEKRLSDRLNRILTLAASDVKGRDYQRRAKRRATAHLGIIEAPDGRQIDCNILELTDAGIRIGLRSDYAPPSRFAVRIPALRVRYAARLKWTSHHVLGAEIIAPLPFDAPAERTRWMAKALGETGRRFMKGEGAGTAIEYALLAGVAAIAVVYGVKIVGGPASDAITAASRAMAAPGTETTDVRSRDGTDVLHVRDCGAAPENARECRS